MDAWITLGVLAVTLVLLTREGVVPVLVVIGADIVLMVTGVLDAGQALAGFSNPAPFTVAGLYILARAVEKTGALQPLLRGALAGVRSRRRALATLLAPVAASSALLNNTPIVAIVAPQVSAWADRTGQRASAYLMPVSFAAILGGMVTAIGTSTTLVVSGLAEDAGMAPLGIFEITRFGLPIALVGLAYLLLAAPRLVPDRTKAFEEMRERSREFVVEMEVEEAGELDGRTVQEGELRALEGVFLTEVRRGDEVIAPATPTTLLRGGDHLVFVGRSDEVVDLERNDGLRSAHEELMEPFRAAGHAYFEAVVGPGSDLVGHTLREVDFRSRYQAAVVGIHRAGEPIRAKLGTVRLRVGDTLLVLADEGFRDRWQHRRDFLLVAPSEGLVPVGSRKGWIVAAVLAMVVLGNALGLLPILHGALLGALVLTATRVLTAGEAGRAVDLDVVLLIAGAFGLGRALSVTGLADRAADGILGVAGGFGTVGLVVGVVVSTLLLTELVTNNAAAVLAFPVALSVAQTAGLDPRTMALIVAIAASASFLTPIGYQTNTMVWGAGGYRFGDYARLGAPLTLLVIGGLALIVTLGGA